MDIEDIIQSFNDGELDVENYFGSIGNFFSILKKRGVLSQLDPDADGSEEWQNKFLIWLYNNDKPKFYQYVDKSLGDVEFVDGKPYLTVYSRGEFAKLFCRDGRNDISQDTIESILDGENDWGYYGETTDDVYRDVVQELTKENLLRLKEYIVDALKDIQIDTDTELLESIAEKQGHEYATIDESNVDEVV